MREPWNQPGLKFLWHYSWSCDSYLHDLMKVLRLKCYFTKFTKTSQENLAARKKMHCDAISTSPLVFRDLAGPLVVLRTLALPEWPQKRRPWLQELERS